MSIVIPTYLLLTVSESGGILSESLARLGFQVTGIDPSPENITVAQAHSLRDPQTQKINYVASTIGTYFSHYIYIHTYLRIHTYVHIISYLL